MTTKVRLVCVCVFVSIVVLFGHVAITTVLKSVFPQGETTEYVIPDRMTIR